MKSFFSSIRMALVPVSGLLVIAVLLSACSKFDDDDNSEHAGSRPDVI